VRKLTLDEWEKKYIVGKIERFNSRNSMFTRPTWDPEVKDLLEDWSFTGDVKDRPGYHLEDQALRWASRRGSQLMIHFNIHKPNPSPVAQAVTAAIAGISSGQPSVMGAAYRPPEGVKIDTNNPEKTTRIVKKVARYFGADLVGVCKLEKRWVYSHAGGKPQEIPDEFKYAVVLAFEEEYDLIKHYPTYIADAATSMGYSRMAIANNYLTFFIQGLGYQVIDCTTNDVAASIPLAMQAGLGDIGRNGLLITPQSGPRVRLSKIFTDLPLVVDSPIDFGVTEFCLACGKCADACPSRSIMTGGRTAEPNSISNIGGTLKWPIDVVTCRVYWGRANKPCTACVASCPYNKPDTLFHRTARWFTDYARWADSFYVKMDEMFGYGKPKKADNFWEEWQPQRL